ncbi:MAG: CHAP domain-containing protein [Parcubacteria group bacterium]|jgi:surface antigen
MNADKNVQAVFTSVASNVNVYPDTLKGSVVSGELNPLINCSDAGNTCSASYMGGDVVSLSANSKQGYKFVRWEECGAELSTSQKMSFTMGGERNITPVFEVVAGNSFQCKVANFDIITGDECVIYVRNETGISSTACSGEAADCFEQARAAGYATGSTPRESAIIVFDRVPGTALSVGHVGIVTGYSGNRVSIHDSNWIGHHVIGDHTETIGTSGYSIKGYIYCAP